MEINLQNSKVSELLEDDNQEDFNKILSEIKHINKPYSINEVNFNNDNFEEEYKKHLQNQMYIYQYGTTNYIKAYEEYYGKKFELNAGSLKLNKIGE
jgi:hypothetical protein